MHRADGMTTDGPGRGRRPDVADDVGLLARVASGDGAAFARLYDRHADVLFGTAIRFLRDREAAEDVVQDVFISVWQRAGQFDPRSGTPVGWLLGIARNRAIDRLRAEARRPRPIRPVAAAAGDVTADDQLDWADRRTGMSQLDRDVDPVAAADRQWIRSVLRTTLAEMPHDERTVVVLAYDQDLTQSEIAARLGVPIGTVKSRTRRALARLRAYLSEIPDLGVADGLEPVAGSVPGSAAVVRRETP